MQTQSNLCPLCNSTMKTRNGSRGSFLGCSRFPQCRGTRTVTGQNTSRPDDAVKYDPIEVLPGSDEQEAIWEYLLDGRSHVVVNAGPGTGKTWTSIQYCLRAPKDLDILFVAFNSHIAMEANGKLRASKCYNVKACTYHSLGLSIIRAHYPNVGDPDENKMRDIFERLSPPPAFGRSEWRKVLNLAEKLTSYVKNYLVDYTADNFRDEIERIADHHGLDVNGEFDKALALVAPALDECKKMVASKINFDDMIWLPIVLDLPVLKPVRRIITDESQDLNVAQHELMFRACPSGRCIVVGDRHQAIYQFRGAVSGSMDILTKRLGMTERGVKEFPLTITRRCSKSNVRLAQGLFPEIQSLPDAPEGDVLETSYDAAVTAMRIGDMVICRVNQGLVKCAYDLIRRGIRPAIKGRDIGTGLLSLTDVIEKTMPTCPGPTEMDKARQALSVYRAEQMRKLTAIGDKAAGRITSLTEKCDCLGEFIAEVQTLKQLRDAIERLFPKDSDANFKNAVVLGTVHRTKGLEAERVYVLSPELLPHPMARKDWEREGEKNVAWIAATRAKFNLKTGEMGTLIFCGKIPAIYLTQELPLMAAPETPLTVTASGTTRGFSLKRELERQKDNRWDETHVRDENDEETF